MDHRALGPSLAAPVLSLLLLAALGGFGYEYYVLYLSPNSYTAKVASLSQELATATSTNQQLTNALTIEQARNDNLQNKTSKLNSTVSTLDKLSKIDPQLLAKYSKVYFLNENYTPASLSDISKENTFDRKQHQFLTEALSHLEDMLNTARAQDVDIKVLSSYRSFDEQTSLKASYKVTYGTGANAFSADQGYSEHQLGTAADFTTPALNGALDGFDKAEAYTWLKKNAYKYGFELSYPSGNAYYVFEPWHWRYVGIKLATKLHDSGENFYDMDQREINTYLIDLF